MNPLLDPNFAYLLLLIGFLLGLLALVTPGTGALELGALFCLVLAGYSVSQLEFNLWALILLGLSLVPFIYAIQQTKREIYLGLSILGFVIGSLFLFINERGGPAVHPLVALTGSVFYAGLLWIAIRKSLQAFHAVPTHDLTGLVGQLGEARTEIHEEGSVQVSGELWSARSKTPIEAGAQVRVIGREGFILNVESTPRDFGENH